MAVSDDFFEIDGILLEGGAALSSGAADPSTGIDLPKGSAYLRTNGEMWIKFGDLPTEWRLQSISKSNNLDGGGAFTVFDHITGVDGGGAYG